MKVLVAEDSAVMRRVLTSHLASWNYEVVEAEDGAEAWRHFQAEPISLVLSDWMMPEMDGVELIRRIRARQTPGYVYCVLLTAKSGKEDLVEAMEAGADDFLGKPYHKDELRVRLREGERIIRLEQTLAQQNLELRETQAALVESEKMASLGQFAAGMAHEINNPIAYVANNLAVLRREASHLLALIEAYQQARPSAPQGSPEWEERLAEREADCDLPWLRANLPRLFQVSLEGLSRVRDIVKNLREFARLDEAELDDLNLNAAVDSTLDILHAEIEEKQLRIERRFEGVPPLVCRPLKIHQLIHNLLLNAIQASDRGGRIELRTGVEDDGVVLEVRDEGSGIAESHLARIFEPFFTTKPIGQGMGLGLAISYGVVRDQGGAIEVESTPGRGSTFRVHLPRTPRNDGGACGASGSGTRESSDDDPQRRNSCEVRYEGGKETWK